MNDKNGVECDGTMPIKHIWFQNSKGKSKSKDTYKGVIFYHGVKDVDDETSAIIKSKQYSLITDLSENKLFSKISKNFRCEIRRAQKEDMIHFKECGIRKYDWGDI